MLVSHVSMLASSPGSTRFSMSHSEKWESLVRAMTCAALGMVELMNVGGVQNGVLQNVMPCVLVWGTWVQTVAEMVKTFLEESTVSIFWWLTLYSTSLLSCRQGRIEPPTGIKRACKWHKAFVDIEILIVTKNTLMFVCGQHLMDIQTLH